MPRRLRDLSSRTTLPPNAGDAMKDTKLNISLPADLARFVQAEVASGHYSSASEVVSDGLRKLQTSANGNGREHDEFDRAKVAEALDGLRRLSATQTLGHHLTLRELIDEGRA